MSVVKKQLKKDGITIIELLITISLMGLIFGLGVYPMISQQRMIREERREISLFDEANLAVYYLTRDAMMAEYVTSAPGANSNVFLWINQHSLDRAASPLPNPRIYRVVNYYIQVAGPRLQLMRDEWDSTQTIRINQTIITDKLDTTIAVPFNPFMFSLDPISNPVVQRDHHIRFVLELRDPDNPNIATRRDFDMMLRCRDTRR